MTDLRQPVQDNILLADNDVLLRAPIAEYLRGCGYRVIEATNADEAKLAMGRPALSVSLVISALRLAGDGFGISHWAKQHRPGLKVTVVASPRKAVDVAASLCGRGGTPGMDPQILLRRVQRLRATRKPPPNVA